jgi:glycerophosphoryl diester phosphodiesterase
VKIFAHRGDSALHPENSRAAIRHCNDEQMHGLEIDIFETESDFVVFHDRWLTRLLNIERHVTSLSDYDLSVIKGNDNEPLPTLAWLIEYCAPFNFTLNIEIKYLKSLTSFENELMQLCEKFNFDQKRLIISSFNHHYLNRISRELPHIKLGLLLAINPLDIKTLVAPFSLYSVHLDMDCLTEELIEQIHKLGLKVFVFTVDHTAEMDWLLAKNVDGIFSNHPRQAFNFVEQQILT